MTLGAIIYFSLLALWSAVISYMVLFKVVPFVTKKPLPPEAHSHTAAHHTPHRQKVSPRARFSSHEGFRSLAQGAELTVDDIVKALSRD